MEAVVGDLPNAETEQRLGMFTWKQSYLFHQFTDLITLGQDKVTLVSLYPNKLLLPGLGREMTLDNLMIYTSISRNESSDARSNKEASSVFHESTCGTT
jgi:hypothetical protein